MRAPNGRVQLDRPGERHGSAAVPVPVAPGQVGVPPPFTSLSELKTFPELTSPLAAWTTSTSPSIVSVSCASSTMLRIVYEHEYASPIFVGLAHPLVNEIPCCTSAARKSARALAPPSPMPRKAIVDRMTATSPTQRAKRRVRPCRGAPPTWCPGCPDCQICIVVGPPE